MTLTDGNHKASKQSLIMSLFCLAEATISEALKKKLLVERDNARLFLFPALLCCKTQSHVYCRHVPRIHIYERNGHYIRRNTLVFSTGNGVHETRTPDVDCLHQRATTCLGEHSCNEFA